MNVTNVVKRRLNATEAAKNSFAAWKIQGPVTPTEVSTPKSSPAKCMPGLRKSRKRYLSRVASPISSSSIWNGRAFDLFNSSMESAIISI